MQFPPFRKDKNSDWDRDNKVLARYNDTLTLCATLCLLTVKVKAVLSKNIVISKEGHQRGFVQL